MQGSRIYVGKSRSSFSLLLLVIAAGILVTRAQNRAPGSAADGMDSTSRTGDPCPQATGGICSESMALQGAVEEVALSSASVCVDVGYLCARLESTDSMRIHRWPTDTGPLRIWIPAPQGVTPGHARELQSAVVRGIQYWQRRPFQLVIDTHPIPSGEADIEISWERGLSGLQLGLTQWRWSPGRGKPKFEIQGLILAIHSPINSKNEISPEQVLLTAAHEMGHALGLTHSDSERDVMYPTNTARNLSTRDFRTLEALYRLPNGAVIRKDP